MAPSTRFQMVKLSPSRKAELLDETRWSNDLQWRDIQVISKYMTLYNVLKGTTIFKQGDRNLFMGLIKKGEVAVLKEDSEHENRVLATIGKDRTLGEMALIDGEPRSATAITAQDSVMFVLSKDKFEKMADNDPKAWGCLLLKISKLMSQRLRKASGELMDSLPS
ncbi:MAG: Crp/Fnr family transcriptional regulator [Magnetococcales bacterium]|nr:Crp/Fnr family transcriptional regulator [Magnetococcales bacterium]